MFIDGASACSLFRLNKINEKNCFIRIKGQGLLLLDIATLLMWFHHWILNQEVV